VGVLACLLAWKLAEELVSWVLAGAEAGGMDVDG